MKFPYDTFVDLADFYRQRDELDLLHAAEMAAGSLRLLAKDLASQGYDEKLLTRWVSVYSSTRDGFLTRDPDPEPEFAAPEPVTPDESAVPRTGLTPGEVVGIVTLVQRELRRRRIIGVVILVILILLFGTLFGTVAHFSNC